MTGGARALVKVGRALFMAGIFMLPSLLCAQEPAPEAGPTPKPRDIQVPQPFQSNVAAEDTALELEPNVLSPWRDLTGDLNLPDGFDPVAAVDEGLTDQVEAVTSTNPHQPGMLPLADLPMDDSVNSLTGGIGPALMDENQEDSLPYGLTSWPMGYAPRELIADFSRQRRLNRFGPLRVGLDLSQSAGYYYNVFGSTNNIKNDQVFTFRPYLYLEAGTKGQAQLIYAPEFVNYATYPELNTANQQLAFRVRYPFSKLELSADAFYFTQNGLFLENNSEGLADLQSTLIRLNAEYTVTDKTSVRIGGENFRQTSDPGGSQVDTSFTLDTTYQATDSTVVGGALTMGTFSAPAGDQTYATAQVRGAWIPARGLRFAAEGGLQVRHFDFDVQVDNPLPIGLFSLGADWFPSSTASFSLRFYRSVLNTTFTDLSLTVTTAATTSMLLHVYEKVNVQLVMGIGFSEQLATLDSEEDNFCFAMANFRASYPIQRWLEVEIFNNFQQRLRDTSGNNYISNIAGVAVTLKF